MEKQNEKFRTLSAGPVTNEYYRAIRKYCGEKDLTVAKLIKILVEQELAKNGVSINEPNRK